MHAKFEKSVVMEACEAKIKQIRAKREEEYEQAIAELMKPYSYLFGLIKGQKTREEAEKELDEPYGFFTKATFIRNRNSPTEYFCQKVYIACDSCNADHVFLTEEDCLKIFVNA